jgi:hypothetical protein
VYRVVDEQLQREVALKVIEAAGDGSADTVRRRAQRVLREARASAAIQHENAVAIHDVGEIDGQPFITMELVDGVSLRHHVGDATIPLETRVRWLVQIASALQAAHDRRLVHRDVKPENVMVRSDGTVKVLDFGIARPEDELRRHDDDEDEPPEEHPARAEGRTPSATTEATWAGTPSYMSPEQIDRATVDARSDQFSWGVLAHELLTGERPWKGEALSLSTIASVKGQTLDREALKAACPESVAAVVLRTLAKAPEERFESMREVIRALDPGATPQDGPRDPRRGRAALAVASLAALAVAAAVAMRARTVDVPAAPTELAPLAGSSSVLACPQLEADGVEAPSGWLGAAAATLACARARLLFGGAADRTLYPAELLALPTHPTDDFPHDPYGASDARDRQLAVARARASAVLDGKVEWAQSAMHVTLALQALDGRELARGEGSSPLLYRAVDAAFAGLRGPQGLPASDEPSAPAKEWFGASSATAVLALQDLASACRLEAQPTCQEECTRIQARTDFTPTMLSFLEGYCATLLRRPRPEGPLPLDGSSTAAVFASVGARVVHDRNDGETDRLLAEALERETAPARRGPLLCEQLLSASDAADRRAKALLALQEDPEDGDPRCSSWRELPFAWTDTTYAPAYAAWAPWDSLAWDRLGDLEHRSLAYARRAYVLSPEQSNWSNELCHRLLLAGQRTEAASLLPHTNAVWLQVEAAAAEARFTEALSRAHVLLQQAIQNHKSGQASGLAASAAAVSVVLGRPFDDADALVRAFVEPDPPLAVQSVVGLFRVIAICTAAAPAVARRCMARVDALEKRGDLKGIFPLARGLLDGALRYVAGDFRGAAAAWKPMLRAPGDPLAPIRNAVATALDRSGEAELAEALDDASVGAGVGMYNGVDLSFVRAARRADARGDHARARQLAQKVVDAWSVADATVPAVAEMRALSRP